MLLKRLSRPVLAKSMIGFHKIITWCGMLCCAVLCCGVVCCGVQASGEKVLVFSFFKRFLDLVDTALSQRKVSEPTTTCSGEYICHASEIQTGWSPLSERSFER